MLITRFEITKDDILFLNKLNNIRINIFFTYSGIRDANIEPVILQNNITLKFLTKYHTKKFSHIVRIFVRF